MVVRQSSFYFLILAALAVWLAVFVSPDANLHLVACNVGEGDAILITYKNTQILTDGGPNQKVLDCLSRHLPFWDREIEAVILTHPDTDHYRGLIEVEKRYQVDHFFYNGQDISNSDYQVLKNRSGGRQIISAGKIQIDILAPESLVEEKTNDNSLVDLVSFGGFKALLTGDMVPAVSERLVVSGSLGKINYLKVPHHGSKNGLTESLLTAIKPDLAVISVGKNNYGHPAEEILQWLNKFGVKTLRTDEMGDVEVISDGKNYWFGVK
jgi:competence protein ComEC